MIDVDFDSDHRLLKGKLITQKGKKYHRYMKERTSPTVDLFPMDSGDGLSEADERFRDLKEALETPKVVEKEERSWISARSFELLHRKAQALRRGNAEEVHDIGRELRCSIRKDRRQRVEKVSREIEQRMDENDVIGAFQMLQHWYRKFTGRALRPSKADLEKTRQTYAELFADDKLSEEIPFEFAYEGEPVNDSIPGEEEIAMALRKMRNRKAPGLSRISVDDLKQWYKEANPDKNDRREVDPDARERWETIF